MKKTFLFTSDGTDAPVSSMISRMEYDKETQVLKLVFHNGTTYLYADVPETLANQAFASESIGTFVRANIFGKFRAPENQ